MTDQVAVSWSGIEELIRMAREQHEHHRAIWGFTRDRQLYEDHWFDQGFLSLFRGEYDAAAGVVRTSMGESSDGSHRLVDRIALSRDLLEDADRQVESTMAGLREVSEGVRVPELVRGYGGLTSLGGLETPGEHRAPVREGSATAAIDAVNSLLSMGHHTDQIADGVTTGNKLDDFVGKHGG